MQGRRRQGRRPRRGARQRGLRRYHQLLLVQRHQLLLAWLLRQCVLVLVLVLAQRRRRRLHLLLLLLLALAVLERAFCHSMDVVATYHYTSDLCCGRHDTASADGLTVM